MWPPSYPTAVSSTPSTCRNAASTPQKHPAAKLALAMACSLVPFRVLPCNAPDSQDISRFPLTSCGDGALRPARDAATPSARQGSQTQTSSVLRTATPRGPKKPYVPIGDTWRGPARAGSSGGRRRDAKTRCRAHRLSWRRRSREKPRTERGSPDRGSSSAPWGAPKERSRAGQRHQRRERQGVRDAAVSDPVSVRDSVVKSDHVDVGSHGARGAERPYALLPPARKPDRVRARQPDERRPRPWDLGRGCEPEDHADLCPVRRQCPGLRAKPRYVLRVIPHRVARVAHLAAEAGVEADDAAGFPLGDVDGVAPEPQVEAPSAAVFEHGGERNEFGAGERKTEEEASMAGPAMILSAAVSLGFFLSSQTSIGRLSPGLAPRVFSASRICESETSACRSAACAIPPPFQTMT